MRFEKLKVCNSSNSENDVLHVKSVMTPEQSNQKAFRQKLVDLFSVADAPIHENLKQLHLRLAACRTIVLFHKICVIRENHCCRVVLVEFLRKQRRCRLLVVQRRGRKQDGRRSIRLVVGARRKSLFRHVNKQPA